MDFTVDNADRTHWLASHLYNASLCDEAVEEMGWPKDGGIFQVIAYGQFRALEQIASSLIDSIEKEVEERESVAAE